MTLSFYSILLAAALGATLLFSAGCASTETLELGGPEADCAERSRREAEFAAKQAEVTPQPESDLAALREGVLPSWEDQWEAASVVRQ